MSPRFSSSDKTRKLVLTAVFTALVAALCVLPIQIPGGIFQITLVLPVIVIGVAVCGTWVGAWLGLVFAVMVMVTGGADFFLYMAPPVTYITTPLIVFGKGIAAGFLAGLVYRLLHKKNKTVAAITAAVVAPVVNTGIYLIGCYLFFYDTVAEWLSVSSSASSFVFVSLGVGNFLIELAVNLVLCPVIVRLIDLVISKKITR